MQEFLGQEYYPLYQEFSRSVSGVGGRLDEVGYDRLFFFVIQGRLWGDWISPLLRVVETS